MSAQRGGLLREVSAQGGCLPRGVCLSREVSAQGGCLPRGCLSREVSAQVGVSDGEGGVMSAPVHVGIHTHPPPHMGTEFLKILPFRNFVRWTVNILVVP